MRYNNQLTSKSLADLSSSGNGNENVKENGEESSPSDLSGDSLESCTEPIINKTMMSEHFSWDYQQKTDFARTHSLSALCQPESDNFDASKQTPETPTSRQLKYKYAKHHQDLRRRKRRKQSVTVCLFNCRYDCIPRVAKLLGYKVFRYNAMPQKPASEFNYEMRFSIQSRKEQDMWNLCWTDSIIGVDFCREMRRFQRINHFPGMFEICRKDLLARNLNRMQKIFPDDFNIFPKTWCFPADLGDAIQWSRQYRNKTFIIKPDQGSQGKGIWLTKNLKEVKINERMICQVYINRPLLVDGFKFDLRVYCLVTSIDPLRVFIYNEGLARFATSKYREPSDYNTGNMFMHLTNYSINKNSRMYSTDDEVGTKRKISTLNRILANEGYDVAGLWANIDDVIIKTVLSALPMLKHNYNACFPSHDMVQACFEILGMDILIDSKLKPHILEVNHSPSFHTSEQVDKEVKDSLIRDTFEILNLTQDIKKKVLEEDRRRIRDRLLQKIKDSKDNHSRDCDDMLSDMYLDKHHNWAQQFAWEDTHLGSFRRILPCPSDRLRYQKFHVQQNQLSVYSETAASKRREECAKQQRIELEEKFKYNQTLLRNLRFGKALTAEEDTVRKRKVKKQKKNYFKPDDISDMDERDRVTSMQQREYLIKTVGLLQMVYVNFHRSNLLTDSDKRKYRELFAKLIAENELPSLPLLHRPKPKLPSNQIPISMPTNLSALIQPHNNNNESSSNYANHNETSTSNSNQYNSSNDHSKLNSSSTNHSTSQPINFNEVTITFPGTGPQLPLLSTQNNRAVKATLARQVTNVIKRHNGSLLTDKII